MREEYDIENLNPKKNPYSKRLKKQITANIDNNTVDLFEGQSEDSEQERVAVAKSLFGIISDSMTLEESQKERLEKI